MTGEEIAAGEQNTEEFSNERIPIALGGFAGWRRSLQNFDGFFYDRVRVGAGWREQTLIVDLGDIIQHGTNRASRHNAIDWNLFARRRVVGGDGKNES